MKNALMAGILAAALVLPGVAAAQNAASVVGRAIEVHTSARDAIYEMDSANDLIWEFPWTAPGQAKDVFATYFTLAGPDGPSGQVNNAMAHAFTMNSNNFFVGAPLVSATHTHGGNTWTATPLPAYTGENAPDAGTGWTSTAGDEGEPEPIIISIEDIFIAEQKVLHHKPKPKGKDNRPWNTKISFDLLPEDIADLKIEIVIEGDDDFEPILLLDPLLEHELTSEYADWDFKSSGLAWGNPDALCQVVNDALVSDILQGNAGGDDFPGNNSETGGLRVRITPVTPLTYQVNSPGDYTLRISGTVRGNALDGTSDQDFQVTLGTTIVGGE